LAASVPLQRIFVAHQVRAGSSNKEKQAFGWGRKFRVLFLQNQMLVLLARQTALPLLEPHRSPLLLLADKLKNRQHDVRSPAHRKGDCQYYGSPYQKRIHKSGKKKSGKRLFAG